MEGLDTPVRPGDGRGGLANGVMRSARGPVGIFNGEAWLG